jgi:hypothetical protein
MLEPDFDPVPGALHGKVTVHHRFLLGQHLQMIEHLEKAVAEFEAQVEAALEPFRAAVERLVTIPGVSKTAAHVIIAEIGVDMSRFATVGHLRPWAGLCPQLNESAGKVMSRRLRKGAPWLKTVLVQCAWAATRNKNNYLHAQFVRLRARRSPKKAILAVAAHDARHRGKRYALQLGSNLRLRLAWRGAILNQDPKWKSARRARTRLNREFKMGIPVPSALVDEDNGAQLAERFYRESWRARWLSSTSQRIFHGPARGAQKESARRPPASLSTD